MKKCGINILLALSIFYTAFGQNRGEEEVVENRVVREVFLTPLEDSDVILRNAKLEIFEDGSRKFSSEIDSFFSGTFHFIYLVDPLAETYRTVSFDKLEGAGPLAPIATPEEIARVMDRLGLPRPEVDPQQLVVPEPDPNTFSKALLAKRDPGAGDTRLSGGSCSGYGAISVLAVDPVLIPLAETVAVLSWEVVAGVGDIGEGYSYCQAENPTGAGTHWFVDGCTALFRKWSELCATTSRIGEYYNYDFQDDDLITEVIQFAKVQKNSCATNSATYSWYQHESGEYWWLIMGSATVSGFDSCSCAS